MHLPQMILPQHSTLRSCGKAFSAAWEEVGGWITAQVQQDSMLS